MNYSKLIDIFLCGKWRKAKGNTKDHSKGWCTWSIASGATGIAGPREWRYCLKSQKKIRK